MSGTELAGSPDRKSRIAWTIVIALLGAACFAVLTPPGEAPDEPAHLAYLDFVLRHRIVPQPDDARLRPAYEAYHPPLAYGTAAAVLALAGVTAVEHRFVHDPGFAFQPNRRALVQDCGLPTTAWVVRLARATNLLWLGLAVWAMLVTCQRLSGSLAVALTAGVPFALAPQLLFAGATFGNDAAVTGLVAATIAMLARAVETASARAAFAASVFGGLALWAKASAVLVAPAIVLVWLWLLRDRHGKAAMMLVLPGGLLAGGWLAFEMVRTGTFTPSPPDHLAGSGWVLVLAEPGWVLSTWVSFWAKLGWFNVVFPWPIYLVFFVPTLLALAGLIFALRPASTSRAAVVLVVVVASALGVLFFFMARVDWQPQGRLLLPASPAFAGLAALGLARLWPRIDPRIARWLPAASLGLASATAVAAAALLAIVY